MRFLKTKILRAREAFDKKLAVSSAQDTLASKVLENKFSIQESQQPVLTTVTTVTTQATPANLIATKLSQKRQKQTYGQKRQSHKRSEKGSSRATKNIVINFGKAISSFAVSPLAGPYLEPILEKEKINIKEFAGFVTEAKAGIGGIDSFRSLLLIDAEDSPQLAACKRVFAEIGIIFIKYFSVNWITHGRVAHKLTYLKYRFKVMRRIKNPELFTYISESKRRCF